MRELILDGRIGTCTDQATQSSWPVLCTPQPRAVSPADTTDLRVLPGATVVRHPIARSDRYTAADHATDRHPWQRAVVRADQPTPDHPPAETDTDTETDTEPTTTDTEPTHTDVVIETSHADHHCGGPHR